MAKKNSDSEKFVFVTEEEFKKAVKKPRTSTTAKPNKGGKKK